MARELPAIALRLSLPGIFRPVQPGTARLLLLQSRIGLALIFNCMSQVLRRSFLVLLPALLAAGLASAQAQAITPIGTIQGTGGLATAGSYTIEGVVTGVYAGLSPAGFYVQNDAATADGDPATSDALFVVQAAPTVAVGNRVRISGAVQEMASTPSFNQAVLTSPVITVLSATSPLPAFSIIDNATFSMADAEPLEGMLVEFGGAVTVADVARRCHPRSRGTHARRRPRCDALRLAPSRWAAGDSSRAAQGPSRAARDSTTCLRDTTRRRAVPLGP